jgi:glycosyltransferase involved in cell wall biosynthesis
VRKIKVLECIRQGQIGGGESHLLSLLDNIDKDRFEPVVLSFTDGPMVERLRAMQVDTTVIHTERPFDITRSGAVKKFLREKKPDLVHAHGTRANSNILWAAHSLKIPVIYTVHGWSFHPDQPYPLRTVRILGERYLTAKSDLCISVSDSNRQSGLRYIPSFRSEVVANGIDLRRFNPSGKFNDIRSELGIGKDKILLLFIARFTGHKQPLCLLKAFSKAIAEIPNLHLLMVGEGDERTEADNIIRKHQLENLVTMLPFRQDVPDILAAADIFILPSLWEGLPIGLLEAMAMGRTVIATNVDGSREVVQDGKNGLLIEPDDLENNLVAAIKKLAINPQLRQTLASGAVMTTSEKYSAEVMTHKIEELYIRILSQKN